MSSFTTITTSDIREMKVDPEFYHLMSISQGTRYDPNRHSVFAQHTANRLRTVYNTDILLEDQVSIDVKEKYTSFALQHLGVGDANVVYDFEGDFVLFDRMGNFIEGNRLSFTREVPFNVWRCYYLSTSDVFLIARTGTLKFKRGIHFRESQWNMSDGTVDSPSGKFATSYNNGTYTLISKTTSSPNDPSGPMSAERETKLVGGMIGPTGQASNVGGTTGSTGPPVGTYQPPHVDMIHATIDTNKSSEDGRTGSTGPPIGTYQSPDFDMIRAIIDMNKSSKNGKILLPTS